MSAQASLGCPQTEGLGQGCRRFVAEPANLQPDMFGKSISDATPNVKISWLGRICPISFMRHSTLKPVGRVSSTVREFTGCVRPRSSRGLLARQLLGTHALSDFTCGGGKIATNEKLVDDNELDIACLLAQLYDG